MIPFWWGFLCGASALAFVLGVAGGILWRRFGHYRITIIPRREPPPGWSNHALLKQ